MRSQIYFKHKFLKPAQIIAIILPTNTIITSDYIRGLFASSINFLIKSDN